MDLIPEKRVDKTGKLVTRHVRMASPPSPKLSVPAPVAAPVTPSKKKNAGKSMLRPQQLKSTRRVFSISQFMISGPLQDDGFSYRQLRFAFDASEVEMYAVFAVAYEGDAMKMLNDGVRTTDDAIAYLRARGMEPVFNRTALTQEALRRNIHISLYQSFVVSANVPASKWESPCLADALELYGSASLRDQYYVVFHDILDGTVRLEDIKALGYTKLKGNERLRGSLEALRAVNDPDAKFTVADMKEILEHCNRTAIHNTDAVYATAMTYLISEGPEFTSSVSLKELHAADWSHRFIPDRIEKTKYLLALKEALGTTWVTDADMHILYKASIDPAKAADMLISGMKAEAIVGVVTEEIPVSLGKGWL